MALEFSKTMTTGSEIETVNVKQIMLPGEYTPRLDDMFTAFSEYMQKSGAGLMDPSNVEGIREMIAECNGISLPNLVPTQLVFQNLVKRQVDQIADACHTLVQEAHSYSAHVQMQVIGTWAVGFPFLKFATEVAFRNAESRRNCERFVERMLAKEQAIIFTKNNLMKAEAMEQAEAESGQGNEVGFDLTEVQGKESSSGFQTAWDMMVSLSAYWAVVCSRISDMLSQEIKYSLTEALVDGLHEHPLLQAETVLTPSFSILREARSAV